jgi:putative salt-induced outer membrane protein YdiY
MRSSYATFAVLFALGLAIPARGVDAQGFAWENATELSFVSTAGNASSTTFGVKSALTGTGGANTFKLELGGIRASSTITTRTATGTVANPVVTETEASDLTAASYFARSRYDRAFTSAFAFGGAGWDRNTFAGVKNRFQTVVGVGRTWVEGESGRFKTDIGATYTIQKDVQPVAGSDDAFGGFRVSIDAARRLTASADYASTLIVDENLETTADLRADWINSLTVSISEGLALKTSLQLLYDAEPAFLTVPLLDGLGVPTGTNVPARGDEIDSVATLTLVIRL